MTRDCPRCGADLTEEEGRLMTVYRCPECRFEGVRDPFWSLVVDRIQSD